ncbi:MAG: hypothetical protein M1827_003696 [Pycnora praestabilis]|nr:MAG: hypothetical protein M1827_003696 [Pycnora praestabilis]
MTSPFALLTSILALLPLSSAIRLIESKSLNPCSSNSSFTASLFNVVFTPDNNSLAFDIVGVSSIQGNVIAEIELIAYGYTAIKETINPCNQNTVAGLCPISTGQINIQSNAIIPDNIINDIPAIAYGVPDLDGTVRVHINDSATGLQVACVEAQLSNGKTVDQKGVGWATAVIAGLALLVSAVTSGLGHSNTAAHVAANALSLFSYFQAQAMIGMTAVELPPIVQSWTQNFDWSMGIIRIGFVQDIALWYQQSTGGTPTTYLSTLATTSVEVQKRSVDVVHRLFLRAFEQWKRSNADNTTNETTKVIVVRGIDRYGFRARIESTNIFLTGLIFFVFFVFIVTVAVAAFKGICELSVKMGWLKSDKFKDFRNGWKLVTKGILFRLALIGYPQMAILCLWELTQRDSSAEVVLALFVFLSLSITLLWGAFKVVRIAKRSVSMHKNPAYILYSDPTVLNRWGFLYVQFRATAYYFIVPVLVYIFFKAAFIGFSQGSGTTQAIALVIIEAAFLIGISIMRPWMDKRTNVFNICIGAMNFLNAIFLLVFTSVFNQPGIVTGVMGVIFFVINALFALVLLILVLISSIYAVMSKNPDTRYQPMRDDRGSFIKSQTQLNTELDALGVTARGDMKGHYQPRDFDDDDSFSSGSFGKQQNEASGVPLPPSTATSNHPSSHREPPHSPVDPSVPLFPSDASSRHGPPPNYDNPRTMYNGYNDSSRPGSDLPLLRSNDVSPTPREYQQPYGRAGSSHSNVAGFRQQNSASPWQRGAGYEH